MIDVFACCLKLRVCDAVLSKIVPVPYCACACDNKLDLYSTILVFVFPAECGVDDDKNLFQTYGQDQDGIYLHIIIFISLKETPLKK